MRPGSVVISALHFFMCMGLIVCGIFFLLLNFIPHTRLKIAELLDTPGSLFLFVGAAFLGIAVLLWINLLCMHRKLSYQVVMNENRMEVEESVLKGIVENYWIGLFPEQKVVTDLFLRSRQNIEIVMEIPGLPLEEQEALLEKAEKELGELLSEQLGYKKEFFVTVLIK